MSPAATATAELQLRPGVPVLRRDATMLQIGLHPPLVARLPDEEDVRRLLAALRQGAPPGELTPRAARALDALTAADLVVPVGPDPVTPETAVVLAQFGADGVRRRIERTAHPIGVRGDGGSRAALEDLLDAAGLTVDQSAPAAWVIVAPGPLAREQVDPLIRAGIPHLMVSGHGTGRRVGPFVEPGRTACLRCVDAHEAEADPRRPFLVEQAALASNGREPVDPLLDHMALAWAVRDLCRYVEGDEPSTWSTTVDIGPTRAPEARQWLRHPHCGCAWDLLLDLP